MSVAWLPKRGVSRWVEPSFALAVLLFVFYSMLFLQSHGYLPQPFFYDTADTYMDWFNTAYWGRDGGTYDNWRTIYPPLSFVFLDMVGIQRCYDAYSPFARACDWLGVGTLHLFYIVNVVLVSRIYIKLDRSTALCRSIAMTAGLPMLYGLDRGNLVGVCFTCLVLAFGPLLRSARLRWLMAGLAINFKVYLIASIFPLLIRRRWRWFEGALLATFGVYVVTYAIMGRGAPSEIYHNLVDFSTSNVSSNYFNLWYMGTYQAVLSLLNGPFPMTALIGSRQVELWTTVLTIYQKGTLGLIVIACAAAWLRPEAVPTSRLVYLGIAFALLTSEAGGYTQIYMLYFVFMEPWKGVGRKAALIMAYLLSLPCDFVIYGIAPFYQIFYLSDTSGYTDFGVSAGLFLRPGLLLAIAVALSMVTVNDVWGDIRAERWRDRLRFRRDFPLLKLAGRRPPIGT